MTTHRATSITLHIGAQVRQLRRERGLSQQRFADLVQELTQFNRMSVQKIENGQRERVSVDELLAFAKVLSVPYARLVPEQDPISLDERLRAISRAVDDVARDLLGGSRG